MHHLKLRCTVKEPTLFVQSPETISENIWGVVRHFKDRGLTIQSYLRAALAVPRLFSQLSTTIAANIEEVVKPFAAFGLSTDNYIRAACARPMLFGRSPNTIARHIHLLLAMYDDRIFDIPISSQALGSSAQPHRYAAVLAFLMRHPKILCFSDDNLALRRVYVEVTRVTPSPSILTMPRHSIESELLAYFGYADSESVSAATEPLLLDLIQKGYLKSCTAPLKLDHQKAFLIA